MHISRLVAGLCGAIEWDSLIDPAYKVRKITILTFVLLTFVTPPASIAQPTYAGQKVVPAEFKGDLRDSKFSAPPRIPHALRNELDGPAPVKANQDVPITPNIGVAPMPAAIQNFAGLSFADVVTGGQAGAGWPPDINGDVGRNHYIQAVNEAYAIYSKTGTLLVAFTENSLWSGAGTTPCSGNSYGDPVVMYDQLHDRWFLSNLAFASNVGGFVSPYYECIAVSKTSDPVAGGWWLYALRMDPGGTGAPPVGTLHDYPKFGIWNDGCLYMSANGFAVPPGYYTGAIYASFSLADMEAGSPVTWSLGYINNSSDPFSMLPSNLLGVSAGSIPPAGTPNYFVSEAPNDNAFEVRKFTPGANCGAGGSLSAPVMVSHTAYTYPYSVPQPNTYVTLDALGGRLMQKLQYRKVGNTESLWVAHSVQNSGSSTVAPQWAQLDVTGGTIASTPVQQQIYTPDTTLHRWMASIAADRAGNMAIGYSTSNGSSPNFPSIAYSGRLATDPLNNLSQTETVLISGLGSQTNISRWGDYTSMSIDPVDDCTFWYANQYYSSPSNGVSGNWQTRIGSFKFSTCAPTVPTLGITKTHSGDISRGQNGAVFTVSVSNFPLAPATTGAVTVTDTLPAGLTLVSITGTGWTCDTNTVSCSRSDSLAGGSSYPVISVTVNVAPDAAASLVNSVTVTGGGSVSATGTDMILVPAALTVNKSHTGNFTQGQNGATYTVTVSNRPTAGTTIGTVTVTETMPSGLTLSSMTGTGWNCPANPGNTCNRSDALTAGSSYPPLTVTVSVGAAATSPQVNTVGVAGGGSPAASTTDSTIIIPPPPPNDEIVTATVIPSSPYTTTQDTTQATTNTNDPVQSCGYQNGKTVWFKYVGDFTGTLEIDTFGSNYTTVLSAYRGSVSASTQFACSYFANGTSQSQLLIPITNGTVYYFEVGAYYSGSGGTLNLQLTHPSILSITKSHSANFIQGQTNATYKVVVSNSSAAAPTTGTVTVTESIPSSLTLVSMSGTGWNCPANGTTCNRSDSLPAGASYPPITVTVNVATNAYSYVYNYVTVTGGGSQSASAYDSTNITVASLGITKTHSGTFVQGMNGATYTVTVTNQGGPSAVGTVTVTENIPSGLTLVAMAGTGWQCSGNTCNRSDGLSYYSSYPPITVTVNVSPTAASPQVNSVTVSGGGYPVNATATDSTTILAKSLLISKTHSGNFTQGQTGATYTLTVTNPSGAQPTSGDVTVQENLPSGLTLVSMTGTGWTCYTSSYYCWRNNSLAAGLSYPPITVTVNVSGTATSPQVNSAIVSSSAGNSSTVDSTTISIVPPPNDETSTATSIANLPVSLSEDSTLATANAGDPPQSCSLLHDRPKPAALQNSKTVWFKYVPTSTGPLRIDTAGSNYDTVLSAYAGSVAAANELACSDDVDNTLQSRIVIPVTSGQTYYVEVASYGSSGGGALSMHFYTPVVLSVTKTHTGNFTQGQKGATYTLTVKNTAGAATSSGSIQVNDTLPPGLSYASATGTGWSCYSYSYTSSVYCYRYDSLAAGASFPPITLTVDVATDATSPLVNSVVLTGGGSQDATTNDTTIVQPSAALLSINKTHSGTFRQGQAGATYTVTVSNQAGAVSTNGTVTVTETKPPGLTLVSMAGNGWTCPASPGNTCNRSDALAGGASYPPITVTVNVAANATTPQVNVVSVSGGGSPTANGSDSTPITQLGPLSVTPNSGAGGAQTYQLLYADSLGASDLATVWVYFTPLFSGNSANTCILYYDRAANKLFLEADNGSAWTSGTLGANATLQNSQCAVNLASTTATPSGSNLTVSLPLTFTASFSGDKQVWMYAANSTANSGWIQLGSWTVSVPQLNSISPTSQPVNSGDFTITANGSNFLPGASLQWTSPAGGVTSLTATFINASQLQATVPNSLLASAGTAQVAALSGGVLTASRPFSIAGGFQFTSMSPNTALMNSPSFTLTANGAGFVNGASVRWTPPGGGSATSLTTTFVSAQQLQATVPANLLTASGTAQVAVVNADTTTSSSLPFIITSTAAPHLDSLNPTSRPANGAPFTMTLFGSGFDSGAVVSWTNPIGARTEFLPANFISSTQLSLTIPTSLLTGPGAVNVSVIGAASGLPSNPVPFTISQSTPVGVVSMTPNSGAATTQTFQLQYSDSLGATDLRTVWIYFTPTFSGSSGNTCILYYDRTSNRLYLENDAATSWTSAALGTNITLQNSQCGANTASVSAAVSGNNLSLSLPLTFTTGFAGLKQAWMYAAGSDISGWQWLGTWTVPGAGPQLTSLSPNTITAGSPAFTLTANGSGFTSGASIQWTPPGGGSATSLTTTFVNSTQLTATVPANLVNAAGTAQVAVQSGGQTTSALPFIIAPQPQLTSISPNTIVAGAASFTLTANGSGFVSGANLVWVAGGVNTAISSTFINSTQLQTAVPANLLTTPGTAQVSVISNGQTTASLPFTITAPAVQLTSISPTTIPAGSATFTLTGNGSGFVNGATLQWTAAGGGAATSLATTFVNSNQLTATVPASLVTTAGTAQVSAKNPDNSVSSSQPFVVASAVVSNVSVTPNTGAGAAQVFQFKYSDTAGAADLQTAWADFTSAFASDSSNTCRLYYDLTANLLYLQNDAGTGYTSGALGTSGVLQNSQCNVALGSATATRSGNDFILSAQVTPLASYSGAKQIWMCATGSTANSGWQQMGSWTAVWPQLTSISPVSTPVNSPAFTLTANGSGFLSGAFIQWATNGGTNITTFPATFISASQLQVTIPANLLTVAGTADVRVLSGNASTGQETFTITPLPQLTSIDPPTVAAGSGAFTLTATGSGFVNGATVQWTPSGGGSPTSLTTTFISSTQLQANVPPALVNTTGSAQVAVLSNGVTTSSLPITITGPQLLSIVPNTIPQNSATFTLIANGVNFASGATVQWTPPGGGSPTSLTTTVVNANQLQATVSAGLLVTAGTAQVAVYSGGAYSTSLPLVIAPPQLTSISPNSALVNSSSFTLAAHGLNFVNGANIQWTAPGGGSPTNLTTTFLDSSQLQATVPASLLTSAGTAQVAVYSGVATTSLPFTITSASPPQLTSITPNTAQVNSAAFTLTANGTGFVSGAAVQWTASGGSTTALTTTYISSTQLQATVPASLLTATGTAQATVKNPDNQVSGSQQFTITPATGVSAISVNPGSGQGAVQSFQFVYFDSLGATDLRTAWAYFIPTFSGNSANTCILYYDRVLNRLYLENDAATNWSSGSVGSVGRLENSQCTVGLNATVNQSGNTLSVSVPMTFTGTFTGAKQVWLYAAGSSTVSGWQHLGDWTIPAGPQVTSLNPNTTSAGSPAFFLTVGGYGFSNGMTVRWTSPGGASTDLSTTFGNSTLLTATVPANLVASVGTAHVAVSSGGSVTPDLPFIITAPAPQLSSLSPNTAVANSASFTLTANGANFVNGASIQWTPPGGGSATSLTTSFTDATQLTATVPANLLTTTGTAQVAVLSGGIQTSSLPFTITTASPQLTSISPNTKPVNSAAFTLTANGSNFVNGASVQWTASGGATTVLTTYFGTTTQLTAVVPANLLTTTGTAQVAVKNPDNSISLSQSFVIGPAPTVTAVSVNPNSGSGWSKGFDFRYSDSAGWSDLQTVSVFFTPAFGSGTANSCRLDFEPSTNKFALQNDAGDAWIQGAAASNATLQNSQCSILLSGSGASPSGNNLQVSVLVAFTRAFAGAKQVWMYATGGTTNSGWQNLGDWTVTSGPVISSISPNTLPVNSPAFTLTVNGSGFTSAAIIDFIPPSGVGTAYTPSAISDTQLQVTIPASQLTAAGAAQVMVFQQTGYTPPLPFTITAATPPQLTSISPSTKPVNSAAFTLTANGSNFVNGASIQWTPSGGSATTLTATFVNSTQLTATVPASLLTTTGTAQVAVKNPDNSLSSTQQFVISGSGPTPVSVTPSTGLGSTGTFQFQFSDSLGATDLKTVWAYFTAAFSGNSANSCIFYYDRAANRLYLENDLGNNWTSGVLGSGYLNNSQCLVNLSSATAVSSGNTLTLSVPIAFYNTWLGAKQVWMYAANNSVNSGWQHLGDWTVVYAALNSISPATAAANSPAFTMTLNGSDFVAPALLYWVPPAGAATTVPTTFISSTQLQATIPASLLTAAGTAQVAVTSTGYTTAPLLPFVITGSSQPAQLSSISPNTASAGSPSFTLTANGSGFASGASVRWTPAGSTTPTTLSTNFIGATQLQATVPASLLTAAGTAQVVVSSGGTLTGSLPFTITAAPSVTAASVNPNTGSGASQTFQLKYSDSAGAADLRTVWAYITTAYSGNSANSCIFYYERAANRLYLEGNDGTSWTSGIAGASASLQNSQCSVNLNSVSVVSGGNDLTLSVPVSFAAAYAGAKQVWMYAAGSAANSGWQQLGNWTVVATQVTSINPSTTPVNSAAVPITVNGTNFVSGAALQWTAPGGAIVNVPATFVSSSQLQATIPANLLTLAGTAQIAVLNPGFPISNAQPFAIAAPPGVTAVSVTPNAGSGATQIFRFQYTDSLGATDLRSAWAYFTPAFSSNSSYACIFYYDPTVNRLYLENDAGTGWISAAIGTSTPLQNSQCSLGPLTATITSSGVNLTVSVPVTFSAVFTGAKQVWLYAAGTTANSGWQQLGSWTPQ